MAALTGPLKLGPAGEDRGFSDRCFSDRCFSDRGFSVIEAVLALALLASAAALLQNALTGTWLAQGRAQHKLEALQIAEGRLAAAGVAFPLAAGTQTGHDASGYTWVTTTTPSARGSAESGRDGLRGYWVRVDVSWQSADAPRGNNVSLTALKIARGALPP